MLPGKQPHEKTVKHGETLRKPDPYDTVSNVLRPHYLTFVGHMMQVIQCKDALVGKDGQPCLLDGTSELIDFRERMFDNHHYSDRKGIMVETIQYDEQMARAVAEHVWAKCAVPNAPWQVIEAGLFMILSVIRFARPGK